jgi:oligopeptide/dipeptide ABC transporter ATP-binding protein
VVAVMYLGVIIEMAPRDALFCLPLHPYTQALLESVPTMDPRLKRQRQLLTGDVPSPSHLPSGCRFRMRCSRAILECAAREPPLADAGDGHLVACHFAGQPGPSSPITASN